MEIKFSKFDKETSLDQQRKLFVECFPENAGTPVVNNKHYLWKFHSFPHSPGSYEYKAQVGNDMIGYYAAIPYSYNFFQKCVTAGMVCDVMTGVKARGKGVFTKLGKFSTDGLKEQGLAFATGYPVRKEVIPGHLKVGWEIIFEMPMFIKFIKTNSLLKNKNLGFLSPLLNLCIFLYDFLLAPFRRIGKKEYAVNTYSQEEIDRIEGLEEFIKSWQGEIPISLNKDNEFLKWRLGSGKNYFINAVKQGNKILGLSISRKMVESNIPTLGVLDFMVLNNDKTVISILHRHLRKTAININAEAIVCMTSNVIKKKYRFFYNGFLKSPFRFFLIVKKFDDKITYDQIKNVNNWHLMWIDSDDL